MPPSRWRWRAFSMTTVAVSLLVAPLVVQAQSSAPDVHVVRDGETLSQIALDANTDADTIAALNGLSDANVLSVGQSLKLPSVSRAPAAASGTSGSPGTSGSYAIADGDTLWDIAQRVGTTTDAIVQLNHLDDPDHLSLGTGLSLPAGRGAAASAASSSSSSPSSSPSAPSPAASAAGGPSAGASPATSAAASGSTNTASKRTVTVSYTVQPGETLSQIARQFSVRTDAIVQATSLDDPNRIRSEER